MGKGMWPVQHSIWGRRGQHTCFDQDVGPGHVPKKLCGYAEQVQWVCKSGSLFFGGILNEVDFSVSVVALVWVSEMLRDTYIEILGSGNLVKLLVNPVFDLQLLKTWLQKCASVVFGSFNPFLMAEFFVVRLKCADYSDWMEYRLALSRAFVTRGLSMLSLLEVVASILCVAHHLV